MSARRLLIVRVGAMGDVLHALFAASALRQAAPDWRIDWAIDQRWRALIETDGDHSLVDTAVELPIGDWKRAPFRVSTARSFLGLRTLRRCRYDPVVDLQGTMRSAAIGRLAGAGSRWGWNDPRERAARFLYSDTAERRGAHIVEQMTALLGEACAVRLQPTRTAALPCDPGAEAWAEATVRAASGPVAGPDAGPVAGPVALLMPTAGWGAKQWPTERFGALARGLADRGFTPLLNAARADDPAVLAAAQASEGAARTSVCSVAELIALTRRAALAVGGDTGPVHLAAALGVPTVALFGPTDPSRNGPWGAGPMRVLRDPASITSHKRVGAVDPGLARISVDAVLDAAGAVTGR